MQGNVRVIFSAPVRDEAFCLEYDFLMKNENTFFINQMIHHMFF